MSAQLLDGRALANTMKEAAAAQVETLRARGIVPTLAVMRLGDDKAAAGYARAIAKNCASVGVEFRAEIMDADVTQTAAASALQKLNNDPNVHGIMILEPVPDQIDMDALVMQLKPGKDIDGVHPVNAGRLAAQRAPYFVPATPAGGIRLLEEAGIEFKGKNAVVVGRSDIVGKPMAMLLLHRHCTVTIAHSRTVDLPGICRQADILCVAVGRPAMVTGDYVKPGAVVVDFGTTYTADGLKGDCEQASVAAVAGMMTPVPGGAGPVTNMMLMSNLLEAATKGE
ncbi:MAG: bifunctional 5,10-methylenetetrahydrofolate dehydrogenase/5,10-methenyltetrahydrofolate cyclohydrolase [Caldilineaceae bacterium]